MKHDTRTRMKRDDLIKPFSGRAVLFASEAGRSSETPGFRAIADACLSARIATKTDPSDHQRHGTKEAESPCQAPLSDESFDRLDGQQKLVCNPRWTKWHRLCPLRRTRSR